MKSADYLIAASILSADFAILGDQIRAAESAGADWIHVDVMDGHFVPNISLGPLVTAACRRSTTLPLDVHLMIENPEAHLQAFAEAGADSLTVHVETAPHLHRLIGGIHELGCRAGVALNPGTPFSAVEAVLPLVDLVLVMSVNPGFPGQEFLPEVLPKASTVRAALNKINPVARVEMDGGISDQTICSAQRAGIQVFVAGSSIFNHPQGIQAAIQGLRTTLEQGEN